MAFFASPIRVVHDPTGTPTVILDYDATMVSTPELNGSHVVSLVDRVQAPGAKPFRQYNERNSQDLAWIESFDDPMEATLKFLRFPSLQPRYRADLRIYILGRPETFTLSDTMIERWNARVEGNNLYCTVSFTGGVLAATP